jgi:hypothetical protein
VSKNAETVVRKLGRPRAVDSVDTRVRLLAAARKCFGENVFLNTVFVIENIHGSNIIPIYFVPTGYKSYIHIERIGQGISMNLCLAECKNTAIHITNHLLSIDNRILRMKPLFITEYDDIHTRPFKEFLIMRK